MDPIQINALLGSPHPKATSEDDFYRTHSLDWLGRWQRRAQRLLAGIVPRRGKPHDATRNIRTSQP